MMLGGCNSTILHKDHIRHGPIKYSVWRIEDDRNTSSLQFGEMLVDPSFVCIFRTPFPVRKTAGASSRMSSREELFLR